MNWNCRTVLRRGGIGECKFSHYSLSGAPVASR
jgi:hypothetical protein